jgi:signal peptidase I
VLKNQLARVPQPWREVLDWMFTIGGAVAIVLAIKAWVVNPYRIPSSSMEPTLHCARPGDSCEAKYSDRVLANRVIYHLHAPRRGDLVVFTVPETVKRSGCRGGVETFVKRLIGLPSDRVHEDGAGFIWINGSKLKEPYIKPTRRALDRSNRDRTWVVPPHSYFMMGDNRGKSCDSRAWGPVPRANLIGKVSAIYWPAGRISKNLLLAGILIAVVALAVAFLAALRRTPQDEARQ